MPSPDGDRLPAATHVGACACRWPTSTAPSTGMSACSAWRLSRAAPDGRPSACRAIRRWSSSSSDPVPSRCGGERISASFTTPSCFPTARPSGDSCGISRASTSRSAPPTISSARRSTCTTPTDSASRSMPTGRGRPGSDHAGELTMDTRPLDIQDVIAAGGETRRGTACRPGRSWATCTCTWGTSTRALPSIVMDWDSMPRCGAIPARCSSRQGATITTWASTPGPVRMHRAPGTNDARLLEWELILPDADSVEQAAARLQAAGHGADTLDRMEFACPIPGEPRCCCGPDPPGIRREPDLAPVTAPMSAAIVAFDAKSIRARADGVSGSRSGTTRPTWCVTTGSTSGIARMSSSGGRNCRKLWGMTLAQAPLRTCATIASTLLVSIPGRTTSPACANVASRIRRFCMSFVSRQSGRRAASAPGHLLGRTGHLPHPDREVALGVQRDAAHPRERLIVEVGQPCVEREVIEATLDIDRAQGHDRDGHARMNRRERCGELRGEWQRGGNGAQPEASHQLVAERADFLMQALDVAEDAPGPDEDPLALGGKALEPLAALDDQHAQFLLEVLDAGGERGLRHLARRRRAREMALDRQARRYRRFRVSTVQPSRSRTSSSSASRLMRQ